MKTDLRNKLTKILSGEGGGVPLGMGVPSASSF